MLQLRHYIQEGDSRKIQELLNTVTDPSVIRKIEDKVRALKVCGNDCQEYKEVILSTKLFLGSECFEIGYRERKSTD